jgi:hypothetical protein
MGTKNKRVTDKKQPAYKTPNLAKMQEVVIDARTRIYIDPDADPVAAREKYLARLEAR